MLVRVDFEKRILNILAAVEHYQEALEEQQYSAGSLEAYEMAVRTAIVRNGLRGKINLQKVGDDVFLSASERTLKAVRFVSQAMFVKSKQPTTRHNQSRKTNLMHVRRIYVTNGNH